jgi:serine protease
MKRQFALGLVLALCFSLLVTTTLQAQNIKVKPLPERAKKMGNVEYVRGEVLVKYKQGVPQTRMMEMDAALGTSILSTHRGGVYRLGLPEGVDEQEMVDILRADPDVEYAELNTICHATMIPNDPYYSPYQWDLPKINCPQAWDISTGDNVVVAILDSGIAYENYTIPSYERSKVASGVTQYQQCPDLAGTSFTAGYDFINNDSHPNDNNAHGTHVAGTIAQTTNNSYGVAGMAFDCTLMPVKVLDNTGSGTAQSLADGLYWAADHGAQVVNMSLGWSPGYNPGSTVQNAIQYAYNAGVVLCASSGNAGVSPVSYPAAYSQVIAVGATRYDDQRASYSQYGTALEVTAPGGDIYVDQNGDGYGDGILQMTFQGYDPGPPVSLANPTSFSYWFYEGTSMACPHTVALVAMMIAHGQTGVENIRTILHETAVDLGSAGWDQYYGYGRIDAYAALSYGGTPAPVAQFTGSPTSGCAPLAVTFTDQSTGDITSWSWTFGDGGTSAAQNPSHTYTSAGKYTVSLTVTGPGGSDIETKTNYITVSSSVTAAFVGSPTSGTAPLTVNFTDQSTGVPTAWSWNFGDGGTSTAQNPSHAYAAGTYTVTLTASNACGSDQEIKTNYITVTESQQQCDDFADGNISNWGNKLGTWTATGGYMKGNSTTTDARTTSPFGSFTATTINADLRMNTGQRNRQARIVFAYVNASNYRFIEGDDSGNRWRIYERVNGRNTRRTNVSRTINTGQWYSVTVDAASNGNVTVSVDGVAVTSYKFSSAVAGLVGCGYNRSNCDFDNFCVGSAGAMMAADVEAGPVDSDMGPRMFYLEQNNPNPFSSGTRITFTLPAGGDVELVVFDAAGRRVRQVATGYYPEGMHTVYFDGKDEQGRTLSPGVYFYSFRAGEYSASKKMLLWR